MVQCPELCGRGASSLTSRRPSRARNISTASRPSRSRASRDPLGHGHGPRRGLGCDRGRGHGHVQDVVAVPVLDRHVARHLAVAGCAPSPPTARARNRPRPRGSAPPGRRPATARREVAAGIDPDLALAVIAQARGLEHAGAQLGHAPGAGRRRSRRAHRPVTGMPRPATKSFSARRSWVTAQHGRARSHRPQRGEELERRHRHVLELERDHVDAPRRSRAAPPRRRSRRR